MRRVVHEAAVALRSVLRNADLVRIELARAIAGTVMFAYTVAFAILAYRAGGATALGLLTLARMVPTALLSSPISVLADRYPRRRVLIVSDVLRGLTLVLTAAWNAPSTAGVVALALLVSVAGIASGPARAALVPTVARTPDELTAANVIGSSSENIAGFVGPIGGGLLFAAAGARWTFAACAVGAFLSAVVVSGVRERAREAERAERHRVRRELVAGFTTIVANRRLLLVTLLYATQTAATGVLSVLMIVSAFNLLGFGEEGVGFVNAAASVGSLLGGLVALATVSVRRPGAALGGGLIAWGLPIALVAVYPEPLFALALFAFVGAADAVVDVVGFTILQRVVPNDVAARVFGALTTILFGAFGLGALAGPALVELFGVRAGLVVGGLVVPLLTVVAWPALRWLDRTAIEDEKVDLLRAVPMLAPLPQSALEELGDGATILDVRRGDVVFRERETGDAFYVVADGAVEISSDGREVATAGRGEYFGEIALLRDVPRTATVVAATDVRLVRLERDEFLRALSDDLTARAAADEIVGARLGGLMRVAAAPT